MTLLAGITIRPAALADLAGVDDLLRRSYPRLLAADYPPSVIVTAVPRLARARPALLASGRYFLAIEGHRVVGAAGYSLAARGMPMAEIRHVATDPDRLRQGIGDALMRRVFAAATAEGVDRFACLSTRTAVPFYAALGFRRLGEVEVALAPGIAFPVERMIRAPE